MSCKKSAVSKAVAGLIFAVFSMMPLARPAEGAILMFSMPALVGVSTLGLVKTVSIGTLASALAVTDFALQVPHTHGKRKLFYVTFGVLLLVLDQEVGASAQLEGALLERYPFIEDRNVIGDLAAALEDGADPAAAREQGARKMSLAREKIFEILAPTDLLETRAEQTEQLIKDLE